MWTDAELDRLCPVAPLRQQLPRVLGRSDALDRGFSRHAIDHRLATSQWRRVLPRTYLTADTFTVHDRLAAALLFAGPGAALSGAAALFASGVRGSSSPDPVLVLVPSENRTRSCGWVRVRSTRRPIVVERWSGPRRVEIARAAADRALELTRLDDVRALVAGAVQNGRCTVAAPGAELEAGPRNGSALLRQALEEVGRGAASAPEAQPARILRRGGLTGFVQNAEIRMPDGTTRIVDFFWPSLRACLEIDSVEWHSEPTDWRRTWDRHLAVTASGYSVIHRPPSALRDPARFVADVRAWLGGREADLRRGLS